jgi:hypothetical protein
MGASADFRIEGLIKACASLRCELKDLLGDGDRLPVDLVLALQSLDGKAELAALLLQRQRANGSGGKALGTPACPLLQGSPPPTLDGRAGGRS